MANILQRTNSVHYFSKSQTSHTILYRIRDVTCHRYPRFMSPRQINLLWSRGLKTTQRLDCNSNSDNHKSSKNLTWLDKVVYSSYLETFMPPRGYRRQLRERYEEKVKGTEMIAVKSTIIPPIAFKYLMEAEMEKIYGKSKAVGTGGDADIDNEAVQYPYKVSHKIDFKEDDMSCDKIEPQESENSSEKAVESEHKAQDCAVKSKSNSSGNLISVLEKLKKEEIDVEQILEEQPSVADLFDSAVEVCAVEMGTADPNVPPSSVPCGGCGAILHCQDQSIPGYISSEKFKKATKKDLMQEVCYRCSVLEAHQATLNVNVSPEDYPMIVSKIRERYAMALLLVDLTDFPCSIWPGIMDIIGTRRPVILVGNKVDQLPADSEDYLNRIEESLIKSVVELGMLEANIIHTALISAKTGYGVENLITTIFNIWKGKGDIFILGCTNVGKSTLFNLLIQSDLCKPQATDWVQKSTISQWPGTTLNLLKFPMTTPNGWRRLLRQRRLSAESQGLKFKERERLSVYESTGDIEDIVLRGEVGQTFASSDAEEAAEKIVSVRDVFHVNPHSKNPPTVRKRGQWNPDDYIFTQGYWVYDTPGAVNPNQILDLLTLPELMQTLPKNYIVPQTFYIKPNMSFFVAGLARVDYEGFNPIRFTLFSNNNLPVTMCLTDDAEEVYRQAYGTKVFGVPSGEKQRLAEFPALKGNTEDFVGTGHGFSCADIVLSSIGWIAIAAGQKEKFRLSIHTPDAKGIFIRRPALLPYAIRFKGKRIRETYSYRPHKILAPKMKNLKKQFKMTSVS